MAINYPSELILEIPVLKLVAFFFFECHESFIASVSHFSFWLIVIFLKDTKNMLRNSCQDSVLKMPKTENILKSQFDIRKLSVS